MTRFCSLFFLEVWRARKSSGELPGTRKVTIALTIAKAGEIPKEDLQRKNAERIMTAGVECTSGRERLPMQYNTTNQKFRTMRDKVTLSPPDGEGGERNTPIPITNELGGGIGRGTTTKRSMGALYIHRCDQKGTSQGKEWEREERH